MKTFRLIIASPDGNIFDSEAVNLSLRGAEGDLAIMANHAPFVTSVKEGSSPGKAVSYSFLAAV